MRSSPSRLRVVIALCASLFLLSSSWLSWTPVNAAIFYTVRGNVKDAATGQTLGNVCIILRPPDECRPTDFKTDTNGNWGPAPLVSGSQWDVYYVLAGY